MEEVETNKQERKGEIYKHACDRKAVMVLWYSVGRQPSLSGVVWRDKSHILIRILR